MDPCGYFTDMKQGRAPKNGFAPPHALLRVQIRKSAFRNSYRCSLLNQGVPKARIKVKRGYTFAGLMEHRIDRGNLMLEQELFDLLEGTSDAAFSVTDEGEICSWNKGAEKLFGYPRSAALQKTCYHLLQGTGTLGTQVCGERCNIRECAAKQLEIPNYDLEVTTRSGRRIWVSVSILVFNNSRNGRRLIVHIAHDITQRRKSEELLRNFTALSRQLSGIPEVIGRPAPISPLSEHEKEILHLFSLGKSSVAIARKLGITRQTLRNHLHHINRKLHTHGRLEAVTHAVQRKLL